MREFQMKKVILSLSFILVAGFAVCNTGCIAEIRGPRWHYYHDYDDNYRAHHPWHEDRQDWDR
jgi:hypothetical protein